MLQQILWVKFQLFLTFMENFYAYIDEDKKKIGISTSDDTMTLKRRHSSANDKSKKQKVEEGKLYLSSRTLH